MAVNPNILKSLQLVEEVLQRKKSTGLETVSISPKSLALLRELPRTIRQSPGPKIKPATPTPPVEAPQPKPEPIPVESRSYGDLAVGSEMRGRVEVIFPAGDSVREKLNNLYRIAKQCPVCRKLGTLREVVVFATGNPEADLMFVGEAPGEEEEKQKKPLVGPVGQKLDQIIGAMGLKREKVYISNIVKFRPKIGDGRYQGAKDRKPTPEEMSVSVKIVRSEIEIIKPKVIVALGGTAAEGLLEAGGSVSGMRGHFYELDGIAVAVTYHPSYLLRAESDPERGKQEKRKVWEDALLVMEKLNLPISEKQRRFFL